VPGVVLSRLDTSPEALAALEDEGLQLLVVASGGVDETAAASLRAALPCNLHEVSLPEGDNWLPRSFFIGVPGACSPVSSKQDLFEVDAVFPKRS
jgi:hypothetical protein